MNARLPAACIRRCGWRVDGPELSGTPTPDFPGTRIPYHRERKRPFPLEIDRRIPAPLTSLTESFGFLLTRAARTRVSVRHQSRTGCVNRKLIPQIAGSVHDGGALP